jgi:hypothetical protein
MIEQGNGHSMTSNNSPTPMTEERAQAIAEEAVELAGGTRMIYRSPRHPFLPNQATTYEIEGISVELRHGEISSPAIVTVAGWVFEIHEESVDLLIRPPKPRVRDGG